MSATVAFTLTVRVGEEPEVVWHRLTDLERHTAAIPLTTVTPADETMRPALAFTATTRLGPFHFHDEMTVRSATPPEGGRPGRLAILKSSALWQGLVHATVEPAADGSAVRWEQQVEIGWLPRLLEAPASRIMGWLYAQGLRRITNP